MKRRRLTYLALLGVVIALGILLGSWTSVRAQECRVIYMHGLGNTKNIALEPETLRIAKGSCVVWYNRSALMNVKITFQEGKVCASATDAGMGFKMGYGACYVSSWIPFGGTSSLSFLEKGTYKYVVETASGGPENLPEKGEKVAEGSIIVGD